MDADPPPHGVKVARRNTPDPGNPVHVRADHVNSALRRSFSASRTETEAAFGFQSLSLLNEENQDVDGVLKLRSTPMGRVVFRETHVCPVGEMCPNDVLDVITEPRRCGLCPLAVKSVDHMPSIGARMRMLLEQIQDGGRLIDRMRERNEPDATVNEVQQRRRLDVLEHEGWRTSLLALHNSLEELGSASRERFHVGKPDAVRLHLKLVTRESGKAEFLLRRLCDSAGHTAFETPLLRAQARQLQQRLLTSPRTLEAELSRHQDDPVGEVLGSLRLALEARGILPTFRAALDAAELDRAVGRDGADAALPPPSEA